ncbi:ketopantoate reductase family protein [Paenibacillus agilis]|uniref:2-dehydropantoate 2-reductase n=1 Tax=Paenibacillus agilis TaxID=3020863 RepID=A0A559J2Z7_9BACL|nr:2-dehydropantoate 2-reductase [Paenibacillus agilis]TVX94264.1 2-dehydropantoate 2-reductase [Paenibacillus agilis]
MKWDLIGGGALGLMFTARLLQDGQQVRLWTRTSEQAEQLRQKGLFLIDRKGTRQHYTGIHAYAFHEAEDVMKRLDEPIERLALFIKQTSFNDTFMKQLAALPVDTVSSVLCFQNGIGHDEKLKQLFSEKVLAMAVTTEAAKRTSHSEVIHTGEGETWLGNPIDPNDHAVREWCNLFQEAGFQAFVSNNIEDNIYRKLIVNAVINPLTALLRLRNGELLQSEKRLQLMREVFEEVIAIYRLQGIPVHADEAWDNLIRVCRATASNTSSMLADVLAERTTEIDAITGQLLRIADAHQYDSPVQRYLYRSIQALDPAFLS